MPGRRAIHHAVFGGAGGFPEGSERSGDARESDEGRDRAVDGIRHHAGIEFRSRNKLLHQHRLPKRRRNRPIVYCVQRERQNHHAVTGCILGRPVRDAPGPVRHQLDVQLREAETITAYSITSTYPARFDPVAHHHTRFGLRGSTAIRLRPVRTLGSGNSVNVFVRGSNRAILSASASATQIRFRFLSTSTLRMPGNSVGGAYSVTWAVRPSTLISLPDCCALAHKLPSASVWICRRSACGVGTL